MPGKPFAYVSGRHNQIFLGYIFTPKHAQFTAQSNFLFEIMPEIYDTVIERAHSHGCERFVHTKSPPASFHNFGLLCTSNHTRIESLTHKVSPDRSVSFCSIPTIYQIVIHSLWEPDAMPPRIYVTRKLAILYAAHSNYERASDHHPASVDSIYTSVGKHRTIARQRIQSQKTHARIQIQMLQTCAYFA